MLSKIKLRKIIEEHRLKIPQKIIDDLVEEIYLSLGKEREEVIEMVFSIENKLEKLEEDIKLYKIEKNKIPGFNKLKTKVNILEKNQMKRY